MNPSVIVVEDEFIVSMEIEERLTAMGYRVVGSADRAEDAIELVDRHRPDMILMDIRLKGEPDGISAAQEIRRRFRLPVIFLTAYSEDSTLERAKLAEPYGYLLKPFDDQEVKSTIEIALYRHAVEEEMRRLNRLYDVLSQVNQAVVRLKSREELLQTVCRLLVERGAGDLAWIDWLDPASTRIKTVARFGDRSEALAETGACMGAGTERQGTPGKAILEDRPIICNNCLSQDSACSASCAVSHLGFKSCGSFPIHFQGRVCGALSLGALEPGLFQEREVALLKEVAMDISFALDKMEIDARRESAERSLRESEERLSLFIEHAPVSLAMFDRDMRYLSASRRWQSDYIPGWSDFKGLPHYVIFPEATEEWKAAHRRGLAGEVVRNESDRFERADGTVQWLHWEVRPWRDAAGDVGGIVIFSEDITERKRAENALRHSEERYRSVVETSFDWIWETDASGKYTYSSPRVKQILGYEPDEIIGKSPFDLMSGEEARRVGKIFSRIISRRQPFSLLENVHLHRDGRRVVLETSGTPIWSDQGEFLGYRGMDRDITERKRIEEENDRADVQLREAQKMEAIGQLAGGIAHDFNNILGAIMGYTEIVLGDDPKSCPYEEELTQVLSAAHRAKNLVKQILAFSRRGQVQPLAPLEVGMVVKEVLKLLRASLPATIELRQQIEEGTMLGDGTQIHQIVMNLCTNAANAIAEKGVIEVSLTNQFLDERALAERSLLDLKPGPYLELAVADSGKGMDSETIQHIFEPYFTTNEFGKGTGLGLSVVHGIVKNHGGRIRVDSEPGKGSIFRIVLPSAEAAAESDVLAAGPVLRGTERILWVDDEQMIADMGMTMLSRLGYDVATATGPSGALAWFASDPAAFDLVITDYTMPHMTGLELSREILRVRPDIPIILCTGYNENVTEDIATSAGIVAVFEKPVEKQNLLAMIRKTLDARKDAPAK